MGTTLNKDGFMQVCVVFNKILTIFSFCSGCTVSVLSVGTMGASVLTGVGVMILLIPVNMVIAVKRQKAAGN